MLMSIFTMIDVDFSTQLGQLYGGNVEATPAELEAL